MVTKTAFPGCCGANIYYGMSSVSTPEGHWVSPSFDTYARDLSKDQPIYAFEMAILTGTQHKAYGEWMQRLGFELVRESTSFAHGRASPRKLFLYVRVNNVDRPVTFSFSPYDWVYERR